VRKKIKEKLNLLINKEKFNKLSKNWKLKLFDTLIQKLEYKLEILNLDKEKNNQKIIIYKTIIFEVKNCKKTCIK
jgi:hypothetical protein